MRHNRLANIECLRCIAMLFIVLNHSILNIATGRLSLLTNPFNFCIIDLLYQVVYTGVNIFVLISGYFLINTTQQNTNWNKILQLWLTVFFYSISIYIFSLILNWEILDIKTLIRYLMPIRYNSYWFITQYIGLFIMAPFFARWAHFMKKEEYKAMLLSLFILTSIIQLHGLKGGFSLIWFIFLFMFAGYIRLYENESITISKWSKRPGTIFIMSSLLLFFFSFLINGDTLNIVTYFGFYNGPLLFISSVSFFLYYKKKTESKTIKTIAKLSPYMFGVYLIHEHPIIKEHLWTYLNNQINDVTIYILLLVAFIILILCTFIEFIRQSIFKFLKINDVFNFLLNTSFIFITTHLKKFNHHVRITKKENN